jgi:hypothetical protein
MITMYLLLFSVLLHIISRVCRFLLFNLSYFFFPVPCPPSFITFIYCLLLSLSIFNFIVYPELCFCF